MKYNFLLFGAAAVRSFVEDKIGNRHLSNFLQMEINQSQFECNDKNKTDQMVLLQSSFKLIKEGTCKR